MGTPALSLLHLSPLLSHGAPPGYSGGDRERVTLDFPGDTLDSVYLAVSGDPLQLLTQRGSTKIQPLIEMSGSSLKTPPPKILHPAWLVPREIKTTCFSVV